MRLALDARNIYRPNRRGTGKNLIDLYRRIARLRPEWKIYMFYQLGSTDDPFDGFPNVVKIKMDIPGDRFDFWEQIRLPLASFFVRANILHCPANTAPRFSLIPFVVTIHDFNWLDPRFAKPSVGRKAKNMIRAIHNAKKIITPSNYTKRQIVERFGIDSDKVIVNYWAPDSNCRYVEDKETVEKVRSKYGLNGDKYILAFGAIDGRKNTANLIRAWSLVQSRIRENHKLLIVGIQDEGRWIFDRLTKECRIDDSVILSGFVPEDDIAPLLSGSIGLCYPSLSEGFGLPVLDAFACGCPVVASNVTAIPEVGGEACIYVNPEDVWSMAYGIETLIKDEQLQVELKDKGKERLMLFDWDKCARTVIEVIESVA